MNAPAPEQPVCRCGLPMRISDGTKGKVLGLHYCTNCDTVQDRELLEKGRVTTPQDRAYAKAWHDNPVNGRPE